MFEAEELGDIHSTHRSSATSILLILVGLVFVVSAIGVVLTLATTTDELLWVVPFVIVGVVLIRMAWTRARTKYEVRADGLLRIRSGKVEAIPWADVSTVRGSRERRQAAGIPIETAHKLKVSAQDGTTFVINDSTSRVDELMDSVEESTFPHLLRKAAARIEAGNIVTFGRLGLSLAATHQANRSLPWEQVSSITLSGGTISVYTQGKKGKPKFWGGAEVSSVDNVLVFLALAERFASVVV